MDASLPTWPRNYRDFHFTRKYRFISQLYLAIISSNISSVSQMIFVFIKHDVYPWGGGHHKTWSVVLGRMPWAEVKFLRTVIFIQLELDLTHTLHVDLLQNLSIRWWAKNLTILQINIRYFKSLISQQIKLPQAINSLCLLSCSFTFSSKSHE